MNKILLVNFDTSVRDQVTAMPDMQILRGQLRLEYDINGNHCGFEYQFECPIYECRAVFINLDEDYPVATEGWKYWDKRSQLNFRKYLATGIQKQFLVLFMGKTESMDNLEHMGAPFIATPLAEGSDGELVENPDYTDKTLIRLLKKHIKLPQHSNIADNTRKLGYQVDTTPVMHNKNGDVLASVLTFLRNFNTYSETISDCSGLIMPTAKNHAKAISEIMKWLADKQTESGWRDSDLFYPPEQLNAFKQQKVEIERRANKDIQILEKKCSMFREQYGYFKKLLTAQGDELTDAVRIVLEDVLKCTVSDSDEKNKQAGKSPKEDFQVFFKGKTILVEVKGTIKASPTPAHFVQLAKNALRQGLRDAGLCLILNYDLDRPPRRNPAYPGEEGEELMKETSFIDTQVLHSLAIDVIEKRKAPKDAQEILFGQPGRVNYESQRGFYE